MKESIYNKNNPFLASIKERYSLCRPGSQKETHHVVLDLKGSHIDYQVGDSIAIFPQNQPANVEETLFLLKMHGNELVNDKTGNPYPLREYLTFKANITEISRKFLNEALVRQTNPGKKQFLESLFKEENKELLKKYLSEHHLNDILSQHQIEFSPQEFCNLLMPLLPRFYSIASSKQTVGDEVHLTVALLKYASHNGCTRLGVCSQYICQYAPLHKAEIPVYVQPHHGFTLPHPEADIIMIGPGTGVAPFRAFMQERVTTGAKGKNWLFFGECHRSYNFFYQDFWEELVEKEQLRLDLAFSRDQEHKIYVQHRMEEKGKELFRWLEAGAFLYVCGDAHRMAKDVESALLKIIEVQGGKTEEESKQYLKALRASKRYLRDVY